MRTSHCESLVAADWQANLPDAGKSVGASDDSSHEPR